MPYVNGQYVTDDEYRERGRRDEYPDAVKDPEGQSWDREKNQWTTTSNGSSSDNQYNTDQSQFKDRGTAQAWFDMIGQKYGVGVNAGDVEDLMRRNPSDFESVQRQYEQQYARRGASNSTPAGTASTPTGPSGVPSVQGGNSGGGGGWQDILRQVSEQNAFYRQMVEQEQARLAEERARQAALEAERKARADALYNTLLTRSQQGLNIPSRENTSPNDPNGNIYGQVDLYKAAQDRAHRDYISDLAEATGPLYNDRGEKRMLAESGGQNVANFQSDLISRELQTRRDEIAGALSGMAGMLSADQAAGLQKELAGYDQAIRLQQARLGGMESEIRRGLGMGSLENELMRALMQNQQFYSDLGLRTRTQDDYYDLVRRGRIGNAI